MKITERLDPENEYSVLNSVNFQLTFFFDVKLKFKSVAPASIKLKSTTLSLDGSLVIIQDGRLFSLAAAYSAKNRHLTACFFFPSLCMVVQYERFACYMREIQNKDKYFHVRESNSCQYLHLRVCHRTGGDRTIDQLLIHLVFIGYSHG